MLLFKKQAQLPILTSEELEFVKTTFQKIINTHYKRVKRIVIFSEMFEENDPIQNFVLDMRERSLAHCLRQEFLDSLNNQIESSPAIIRWMADCIIDFYTVCCELKEKLHNTLASAMLLMGDIPEASQMPAPIREACPQGTLGEVFTWYEEYLHKPTSIFGLWRTSPTPQELIASVLDANRHLVMTYLAIICEDDSTSTKEPPTVGETAK